MHTSSFGLEYNGSGEVSGGMTMEDRKKDDPEYVSVRRPIGASDSNHDIQASLTPDPIKCNIISAISRAYLACTLQKV